MFTRIVLAVCVLTACLLGCGDTSTGPPTPKDMGLLQEKYAYDTYSALPAAALQVYQIPSRCVGLGERGETIRTADQRRTRP